MKYTTVIFDLDGVVIDSGRLYDIADTEFLRRHDAVYERDKVAPLVMGKHLLESTRIIKEMYGLNGDAEALFEQRRQLIRETYRTALDFTEGFEPFHGELLRRGVGTCIATSCEDKLLSFIEEKLGLQRFFGEHVYKVSDVGNRSKPDPAIFLYAAEKMGVEPERCVVLEDAPHGILAAKNAGMFCVALTTTRPRAELGRADLIVDAFSDIGIDALGLAP